MEAILHPIKCSADISRSLTLAEIHNRISIIEGILAELKDRLNPCTLCPRHCGAKRSHSELGECGLGSGLRVASVALHGGEEPPISGFKGAINVFFSGCSLHCIHCQNWPISQRSVGLDITSEDLASRILKKWSRGAHSLGWVTPTPQIVGALEAYRLCLQEGFDLPLIHNNGGYEDPEIIRRLSGIVDIWLPDAKTINPLRSQSIHGVPDYPERNMEAISIMVEQVKSGNARAVIVRHLILPGALKYSKMLLRKLWDCFKDDIYLSLMGQYFPTYKILTHKVLGRKLSEEEYEYTVSLAAEIGFRKGWIQHYDTESGISLHYLS